MGERRDYGGPAFPFDEKNSDGTHWESHPGMSLRDYFAAKALQGLISQSEGTALQSEAGIGAQYAYAMADAMLAERSK